MAVIQTKDLPNGAPTALGGDGTISLDSLLTIETPAGISRKISVRDFLGFLGINVGTEAQIDAVIGTQSPPMTAFVTDGRKTNHVQGAGTFAETGGNGTGVLAMFEANSDAESLADGLDVVV